MKNLLFCTLFFTFNLIGFSKNYIAGTITLLDGNVIKASINTYDEDIILSQGKVKYKIGDIVEKVKISEVSSIQLETCSYKMFPVFKSYKSGPMAGKTKTFYYLGKVLVEGNVGLYNVYTLQTQGSNTGYGYMVTGTYLRSQYFLVKEEETKHAYATNYRKSLLKIFDGCKSLKDKLKNKTFKFDDLEDAVSFGNEQCSN